MNLEIQNIGRFQLHGEWAPELLPPMRELLRKYECLLPAWCEIAYVKYEKQFDDALADCTLCFEYRNCRINIGEMFFTQSESERESTFIHELVHANLNVYYNATVDLIEESLGDNALALKIAQRQMRESIECATTDMTALILRVENKREG